jgi:hypothetical protein
MCLEQRIFPSISSRVIPLDRRLKPSSLVHFKNKLKFKDEGEGEVLEEVVEDVEWDFNRFVAVFMEYSS